MCLIYLYPYLALCNIRRGRNWPLDALSVPGCQFSNQNYYEADMRNRANSRLLLILIISRVTGQIDRLIKEGWKWGGLFTFNYISTVPETAI